MWKSKLKALLRGQVINKSWAVFQIKKQNFGGGLVNYLKDNFAESAAERVEWVDWFGKGLLACENIAQVKALVVPVLPGLLFFFNGILRCGKELCPEELEEVLWELKNGLVAGLQTSLARLRREESERLIASLDKIQMSCSLVQRELQSQKEGWKGMEEKDTGMVSKTDLFNTFFA